MPLTSKDQGCCLMGVTPKCPFNVPILPKDRGGSWKQPHMSLLGDKGYATHPLVPKGKPLVGTGVLCSPLTVSSHV